jgi:LysM repeat protein
MKKVLSILFFIPLFALAQKGTTHTVAAKESFTSIGRMYNVNGRELANYNKLDYDKGLSIGQVLKIPATATIPPPVKTEAPVAKVTPVKTTTATGSPIYHIVGKKETLYHISTLYGKVPIADLKKWNNLTGDGVNEGTRLIVGYGKGDVATAEPPKQVEVKPTPVKQEPVVIETEKDLPPVKESTPVKQQPVVRGDVNFNGGAFKNIFQGNNGSNETGQGGVFKSNSGWEDGKYYCLHNTAPEGSIVKITTTSGKSVYAKVLDVMPDIKQNAGLVILISNAAATELGVADKFDCTITYSK